MRGGLDTADFVIANLECCLFRPLEAHSFDHEGFYADPVAAGEALRAAGDAIARASAAFGTLLAAEGDKASVALRP